MPNIFDIEPNTSDRVGGWLEAVDAAMCQVCSMLRPDAFAVGPAVENAASNTCCYTKCFWLQCRKNSAHACVNVFSAPCAFTTSGHSNSPECNFRHVSVGCNLVSHNICPICVVSSGRLDLLK
jgi:hypothetical protein